MTDREKRKLQEKHEKILLDLSKEPGNALCADCNAKGPRWASTNIGAFLCMPCAGLHRKMGTHISKVKSLTLDSWTEEQIEHFRKLGNEKVNALYNPHPEQHPVPVGDSEMEQYIRDKYERKAFVEGAGRKSQPAPASRQGAERGQFESVQALNTLREMGWTDEQRNRDVLTRVRGDVNAAIEVLCNLPPSSIASEPRRGAGDNKLQQLQSLGFTDSAKNSAALNKANGNLEQAIQLLVDDRRRQSVAQPQQQQRQPQQQQQQQQPFFQSGAKPAAAAQQQPQQQQPASNSLDLLGDVFGGKDPFGGSSSGNQAAQQQQKPGATKDSIMSLFAPGAFSSAPQQQQQQPFQQIPAQSGFAQSPQLPQQQQQQPQQGFFGNLSQPGFASHSGQQQPNSDFNQQQQFAPQQTQQFYQQSNPFQQPQQQQFGGFGGQPQAGGAFGGIQQPFGNAQPQQQGTYQTTPGNANPFAAFGGGPGSPAFGGNAAQIPRQSNAPFGGALQPQQPQQPQQQQQQAQQQRTQPGPNNQAFANLNPFAAAGFAQSGGGGQKPSGGGSGGGNPFF